ncbi:hypothetical protein AVEN_152589-1 [Araneus ventricosus]|uniref:Uncharacterized protein n=1 Tax=Araneus ventricosus TaxID=182803 RepID=A0A4Y2G0W8_ARAVE|nr:hypothetical protein AVEN_152589-1 [Araneus ventricosus]
MKFDKLLDNDARIQKPAEVFKNHHEVGAAGEKIIPVLYGSSLQSSSLNKIRVTILTKSLVQNNFNLATFPPTEEAAKLRSWRAFLQVDMWTGHVLHPIKWGLKARKHGLLPVTLTAVQAHKNCLTVLPANVPRVVRMLVVVGSKE